MQCYAIHAQFPDRRMTDQRIFQRLHSQLRKTRSFHVTRHEDGRRRVPSPSLEESVLNVMTDRLESRTRAVAYDICTIETESLKYNDMGLIRGPVNGENKYTSDPLINIH
ncbi:hypothetical protein TNCV_872651 [Trichonephila clavipes]|nr:hypothetical protein TNCV_872651 [Trichonephila clavipes]